MGSTRFGTVLTAMVTPFSPDGSINFDVAASLAKFLVEQGSEGLVIAGSTGEGTALSDKEKLELFACVAEAVTVPVLAGSTFANTAQSIELTRRVKDTGAAGVLVTTPAYSRPSQRGIASHFAAIAQSTPLPIMLYDIPSRTGRKLASSTTIDLVRNTPNIVALKDASGDLVSAAHTKAVLGEDLDLYSGDDGLLLPFLAIGAAGIVSVAAHWASVEFSNLIGAVKKGEWTKAQKYNERLAASCAFESSDTYPNPMPAKAAMRVLGFDVGQCRLPLGDGDETLETKAKDVVTSLQVQRG
jgi:4-hydroxy-tetrahydrodipicolinate synthase